MKHLIVVILLSTLGAQGEEIKIHTVEEITAISPEMIAFLETNIPANASHENKLIRLITLIFNKDFLNLTYENLRTKTAHETFEARSGNCLSFTNMFVIMARHLNLNAKFQEVRNFPNWDRKDRVIVLTRHINVLVQIRGRNVTVDFNPYQAHKQIWSEVVDDQRAFAQFFNNFGAEAFAKERTDLSLRFFKRSIEIDPKMSYAHTNLGVALSNLGLYQEAEAAYLEALSISSSDLTAANNLAVLYRKIDKPDLAKKYQDKANRFRKKNPYYHFGLGNVAFVSKDYEQAVDHYRRAIRRKKEDHQFYFALARTYGYMGLIEKATTSLKKAESYAPDVFDRNRYSQKLNLLTKR